MGNWPQLVLTPIGSGRLPLVMTMTRKLMKARHVVCDGVIVKTIRVSFIVIEALLRLERQLQPTVSCVYLSLPASTYQR
jgi:hypothetical protein